MNAHSILLNNTNLIRCRVSTHQARILITREWNANHLRLRFPANVLLSGLRLLGKLDLEILQQAADSLTRQHEALRVSFPKDMTPIDHRQRAITHFIRTQMLSDTLYTQQIHQYAAVPIKIFDLADCERDDIPLRLKEKLTEEECNDFNYNTPPLIRILLFVVSATEHWLVFVVDHIIADGWSMRIIRRDFEKLYSAYAERRFNIPSCATSFSMFLNEQESKLQNGRFSEHMRFWRQQWIDFAQARIAYCDVPFSLPPPRTPTFRSQWERVVLDPLIGRRLRTLCNHLRVTPHMFFQAAFFAALHYCSGKEYIATWIQFANRENSRWEDTVGFFTNHHLVGVHIPVDCTVAELLERTKSAIIAAQKYAEMPLDYLWQELHCYPRYRDIGALFDFRPAMISSRQITPMITTETLRLPDSHVERTSGLGVYARANGDGFSLGLQYSVDWFDSSGVRQFLEALNGYINAMADHPNERVRDLLTGGSLRSAQSLISHSEMTEFLLFGSELIPALAQLRSD